MTRPGGYFVVVVPAATTGRMRRKGAGGMARRLVRRSGLRKAPVRRLGSPELQLLMEEAGFEVVEDRSIERYTRLLARRTLT